MIPHATKPKHPWPLWFRLAAPLATLWAFVPVALSWRLPWVAAQDWGVQHALFGFAMVAGLSLLGGASLLGASWGALPRRTPNGTAAVVVLLASATASLSLGLTRAALPWEEPGTGMGSPLATLLSVVLLLGFSAVVFGGLSLVVLGFYAVLADRTRT